MSKLCDDLCIIRNSAEPGDRESCQITVDGTPELAKAAKLTLERRLQYGGGHTGWSRAWITNLYARLWDGESLKENIESEFLLQINKIIKGYRLL